MIVDLRTFLYRNYITYDSMYALTQRAFYAYPEHECLNVFIDMHSMVQDIFRNDIELSSYSTNAIASSIINLCAHIRYYYYTRHKTWSRFYIIWSWNRPEHIRQILPIYNAHRIMSEDSKVIIKNLVETNISILKLLCPYIPEFYFVDAGNHETAAAIYTLCSMQQESKFPVAGMPNMVYSRDAFNYVTVATVPHLCMFRPRKSNHKDTSYTVYKTNLLQSYYENELKCKWKDNLTIGYEQFVRTITYAGLKAREIPGLMKFVKASNIDNFPHLFTTDEERQISAMNMAFDLDGASKILLASPDGANLFRGVIDLYNPDEVKAINNLYFTDCPLDLNAL